MSDEFEGVSADAANKRRRRRRRRRRGPEDEGAPNSGNQAQVRPGRRGPPTDFPDDILLAEGEGERRGGRRQSVEFQGPGVSVPASGRNPWRKRGSRTRRSAPGSAAGRRRKLSRGQADELAAWLNRLHEPLLAALYRGLGGQPGRVNDGDRLVQLVVRALSQGGRIGSLVKSLNERERKALAALLQAGGIAHADDFHRELSLSLGGHEREWVRTLLGLGNRGIVFATAEQDQHFFYVIPEPLVDGLLEELAQDLALPTFEHAEVRILESRPFCPPLDFSITTFATWIDQHHPRLTQRHEIHRHDQEEMDRFFVQIWESDSELFSFHLDFLMMHGVVELRGEYLSLNHDVMEEWLQLEAEDQRDLLFRALEKRFSLSEWVLWAVHGATVGRPGGGPQEWIAERPLVSLYRRWRRGEDWRERYGRGVWAPTRTAERESWSFAPLVRCGLLELGQWGQEKFYRLTPRGRNLLEPSEDDGFRQFYLTPSFEIMAPAGLAPIVLFRIGELAELVGCDRANTYRINESSVERGLGHGWRRDDVLQFLRDNSQIGLPENVESTLKGWIGHRGDVEFHDLVLMTVHRSQIRRLEGHRRIKPYLLHRFAPGMYAVDRRRRDEITAVLADSGFSPSKDLRNYPGDPAHASARANLHKLVAEARESAVEPAGRAAGQVPPEQFQGVPGTKAAAQGGEPDLPPLVSATEARGIVEQALAEKVDLEMVYLAKTGERLAMLVSPERFAFRDAMPVLVGLDRASDENRTFVLDKIERLRIVEG